MGDLVARERERISRLWQELGIEECDGRAQFPHYDVDAATCTDELLEAHVRTATESIVCVVILRHSVIATFMCYNNHVINMLHLLTCVATTLLHRMLFLLCVAAQAEGERLSLLLESMRPLLERVEEREQLCVERMDALIIEKDPNRLK
eukprot:10218-Heterococcus_DN1.PRE.1